MSQELSLIKYCYLDPQALTSDNLRLVAYLSAHQACGNHISNAVVTGLLPAKWAERATELIPELLDIDKDWQRVDQFARMLALAHMIRDERAVKASNLSLDWLTEAYVVQNEDVPSSYPGHPHVERFELSKSQGNSRITSSVVLPSCGGVSFKIDLERLSAEPGQDQKLRSFANQFRPE